MLYPTPHIQHLFGLVIDDLTFVSLNRGIPLERKLMTNLLAAGRRGQEFDLAFKYDFVKQIMDKLSEIEYLFSFLTSCQHEIMNLLGDDTEYWLALVHYVIERCKIPLKTPIIELQLSGFQTQTMTLISSMFCHKVGRINRDQDSQSMYKLCEDYPVIMDEKVRQSIMDNEYLLSQFKFVAFIHDLLRAQLAPDTWQQNLSKCIGVWVSYHGLAAAINILKEYNLELAVFEEYCKSHDVNRYIPGEMEKKFEMMCDPGVTNEVRKIVAQTISAPWNTYDKAERQFLSDGCVYLLKNSAVEAADTILRNVIGRENPFDGNNDVTIITYLVSDIGKSFVELLSALRRTQHYNQLSIKDRLVAFHRFWDRSLQNIGMQQTQIAVVQMLSKDQYANYHTINNAFEQSGGTVSSGKRKKCENLFSNFSKVLKWKAQIDLLFETFAPSQQYWDKDIQALNAVYLKLKHWHELSLKAILSQDWLMVSKCSGILGIMEQIGMLLVCLLVTAAMVKMFLNKRFFA